jgi:hypothetical protein
LEDLLGKVVLYNCGCARFLSIGPYLPPFLIYKKYQADNDH